MFSDDLNEQYVGKPGTKQVDNIDFLLRMYDGHHVMILTKSYTLRKKAVKFENFNFFDVLIVRGKKRIRLASPFQKEKKP